MIVKEGLFNTWHVWTNHSQVETIREIVQWCKDNVALNDPTASRHSRKYAFTYERFSKSTNFVFDREQDAFLFALKWA